MHYSRYSGGLAPSGRIARASFADLTGRFPWATDTPTSQVEAPISADACRAEGAAMAFRFRKRTEATTAPDKPSGGWYADPYGTAARRWYDDRDGWTDRVQGEGLEPDKTGVARVDEAT